MAGSRGLRFVLFVSFMIFSTHALIVFLTDGKINGFEYETKINIREVGEMRFYNGCALNKTYKAAPATTKVIVYIKTKDGMTRTAFRQKYRHIRAEITKTLSEYNYELLYLAVKDFKCPQERFIAEFLLRSIEPNPHLQHFQIDVIGEKKFNLTYPLPLYNLLAYQEEPNIFGGDLIGKLRSMNNP